MNSNIILDKIDKPQIRLIGQVADSISRECYIVGGYVRDIILQRHSKDMDFVTVGSGIEVAKKVTEAFNELAASHNKDIKDKSKRMRKAHLSVFENFGTAQVKFASEEFEFVGARKESYHRESRNPIVEDGTLEDDQRRRDFTINDMAICLNDSRWGELVDPYNGMQDIADKIIRTPLDPDITFSDDPLRMMRAIRFATQLSFTIFPETFEAIKRNVERIKIISKERIADELMKIIASPVPSYGFRLLEQSGLLKLIAPEIDALKGVDIRDGRGHKDNFLHTLEVLDHVAQKSDNVWLRVGALFHDIGKPRCKAYDPKMGWTFHNHNFVGKKMIGRIFKSMRLPQNDKMKYVEKLVELHMRPIALVEDVVTDSAVRRLLFDAGDDIEDLMLLCECDITSKNPEKVRRLLANFALVRQKLVELEERDRIRNFQPPVNGDEIMQTFSLEANSENGMKIGAIKKAIKDAILDGVIPNDHDAAYRMMLDKAKEFGWTLSE